MSVRVCDDCNVYAVKERSHYIASNNECRKIRKKKIMPDYATPRHTHSGGEMRLSACQRNAWNGNQQPKLKKRSWETKAMKSHCCGELEDGLSVKLGNVIANVHSVRCCGGKAETKKNSIVKFQQQRAHGSERDVCRNCKVMMNWIFLFSCFPPDDYDLISIHQRRSLINRKCLGVHDHWLAHCSFVFAHWTLSRSFLELVCWTLISMEWDAIYFMLEPNKSDDITPIYMLSCRARSVNMLTTDIVMFYFRTFDKYL